MSKSKKPSSKSPRQRKGRATKLHTGQMIIGLETDVIRYAVHPDMKGLSGSEIFRMHREAEPSVPLPVDPWGMTVDGLILAERRPDLPEDYLPRHLPSVALRCVGNGWVAVRSPKAVKAAVDLICAKGPPTADRPWHIMLASDNTGEDTAVVLVETDGPEPHPDPAPPPGHLFEPPDPGPMKDHP